MKLGERARGAVHVLLSHPNHYMMWGASAALTIIFFVEVAFGVALYQVIFAVIGYSFDYTKDRVWRRSIGEPRRGMRNLYRGIAIGFASFSLLATGLGGLTVAEKIAPSSKRVDPAGEIKALELGIAENRKDVAELKAARDALPADYTTARIKYQDAIGKLEDKGRELVVALAEKKAGAGAPPVSSSKRMFELVADRLNVGFSSVVFWFFMFFGLWLEIGNFATAPELDMKAEAKPQAEEKPAAPRPAARPAPRPAPPAAAPRPAPVVPPQPRLPESILEAPAPARRARDGGHPDLFGEVNAQNG